MWCKFIGEQYVSAGHIRSFILIIIYINENELKKLYFYLFFKQIKLMKISFPKWIPNPF